uniref:TROVE domain-containing protein n=1 Tax=Panagrolaimus sp. JU765 TaxID=591449 RepID=A0AC34Q185_9BILA
MSGPDTFIDLLNAQLADLQLMAVPGQQRKVHEKEVKNNAGGFVFQISDEIRIRRFLILGTCGGSYYVKEKELTYENVADMVKIIQKGKGADLLREIVDISLAGRAPKQDSTLMCLALCAKCNMLPIPQSVEENA